MVSVSGYLIGSREAGKMPLPPAAELQWWYQFYFATERGRAGYDKYRREFSKLIWRLASPKWCFDDLTFDRSAAALDNPDHVAVVIHNYRWGRILRKASPIGRIRKAARDSAGDRGPNHHDGRRRHGAPHQEPAAYTRKFIGKYERRTIAGGIGHNLPQEAPKAFADAIIDVAQV